jgi:hypothetical protein
MVVALVLCLLALRAGLSIRRARLAHRPPPRGARTMHLRTAKPGVLLLLVGFAIGPLTVAFLRNWTPMTTFHALLGGCAAVLFVGAALQGARLERGDRSARQVHAALAAGALLLAMAAAIAGFALLP